MGKQMHGEPPETYELARRNNIEIIDATCPVVLQLQKKIKRQFENLINDFVNERFPKEDRRFPGKERNVLVSANASKGLAVIRIVAQYDPYNLDHYSALECKIKTDGKGNSIVEEKKLLSSFENAHEFLQNGPGEPIESSLKNQKTTELDSKLKAFPED